MSVAARQRPTSSPTKETAGSELTKKKSSVSIVVTRDEACESMWEDHPDELELSLQPRKRGKTPLGGGADFYPLRLHADDDGGENMPQRDRSSPDDDALRIEHAPTTTNSEDEDPGVEEPTPLESLQHAHDDADDVVEKQQGEEDPIDTKASTPSHVAIRERFVDDKHLLKRHKQLDKLRVQLS